MIFNLHLSHSFQYPINKLLKHNQKGFSSQFNNNDFEKHQPNFTPIDLSLNECSSNNLIKDEEIKFRTSMLENEI